MNLKKSEDFDVYRDMSKARRLNLSTVDIWAGQSFVRLCCALFRVLSTISGLYLLDASCDNQQCLQTFPSVPWLRIIGLDYLENGC